MQFFVGVSPLIVFGAALGFTAVGCTSSSSSPEDPAGGPAAGAAQAGSVGVSGQGGDGSPGSAGHDPGGSVAAAGQGGVSAASGASGVAGTVGQSSSDLGGASGAAGDTAGASDAAGTSGVGGVAGDGSGGVSAGVSLEMSFFVTSRGTGNGGDLHGLDGADAFCTELATAVSPVVGAKTWRAYLSTSTVNARDRIGPGPWRNAHGQIIANDLTQLHDQALGGALSNSWPLQDATVALDQTGAKVPAYSMNPSSFRSEVLTGSNPDGTAASTNCNDWTSGGSSISATDHAMGGFSDRSGSDSTHSWNSGTSNFCGPPTGFIGWRGVIYCFALP